MGARRTHDQTERLQDGRKRARVALRRRRSSVGPLRRFGRRRVPLGHENDFGLAMRAHGAREPHAVRKSTVALPANAAALPALDLAPAARRAGMGAGPPRGFEFGTAADDVERHALPSASPSAGSLLGWMAVRAAAPPHCAAALRFLRWRLIAGVDLARRGSRRSGSRGRAERREALVVGEVAFDLFAIGNGTGLRGRGQGPSQQQKRDEILHGDPRVRRVGENIMSACMSQS